MVTGKKRGARDINDMVLEGSWKGGQGEGLGEEKKEIDKIQEKCRRESGGWRGEGTD